MKALIEFATEQAGWQHTGDTSAAIIDKMKAGTYTKAGTKGANGYQNSVHRCTKYVKIALWKAGYSHNNGDIAPSVSPAREMGPALVVAGFRDITSQLPDARWAAPGDIIVYEQLGAPAAAGHIDIRTYDGYISDFVETYLPVTGFKVIGINRKYFDPLPEVRMRAFLKVIRSREASTIMDKYGDDMTYKALPNPGIKGQAPPMFESFESHPFDGKTIALNASGAYGILLSTWKRYTDPKTNPKPWIPLPEKGPRFTPLIQDRIAVATMDLFPNFGCTNNGGQSALGLVRKGDIEKAARMLAQGVSIYHGTAQWTSLPGGKESGKPGKEYTTAQMMEDYEKFYSELQKK